MVTPYVCRYYFQFWSPFVITDFSWQRESFSLQVLGWVFNLPWCQLPPLFMGMVVVCSWLRTVGLMFVSEISGLVWYDHRQKVFPHLKIICRLLNKSCLLRVGQYHVLIWNFPCIIKCFLAALHIATILQHGKPPGETVTCSPWKLFSDCE